MGDFNCKLKLLTLVAGLPKQQANTSTLMELFEKRYHDHAERPSHYFGESALGVTPRGQQVALGGH